jgi:glycosyltransferase involved in cell wall biosynthesis
MAVTDLMYDDLSFSEPLVVDLLWRLLNRSSPGDRILLVGGNRYLVQVLTERGFRVEIWVLGEAEVSAELARYVGGRLPTGAVSPGELPSSSGFDAIVLPLVLEQVDAHPAELLQLLGERLVPRGHLFIATTNLGRLSSRARALLGRGFLPDPRHAPPRRHGDWPALRQYRFYQPGELTAWSAESGFDVDEWDFSEGQAAFLQATPLSIPTYLALMARYAVKQVVPGLREYVVMTLRRHPPRPTGQALPPLTEYRDWVPDQNGQTRLPLVSVVLATRNESKLLRQALSALSRQTYPADRYEIIVIDDGSQDDTREVIEELAPGAPCLVRNERIGGAGIAAARNVGTRLATGVVVAHVSAECEVTPGWIEAGVLGFERNVAVVAGPIILRPEQQVGFFDSCMIHPSDDGRYPGANVFYRRDLLLEAGGFDESFSIDLVGRIGWDCAPAWRMLRDGFEARFRDAYAYAHVLHLSPQRWLMEGWWAGSVIPTIVRDTPELRSRTLVGRGLFLDWQGMFFKLGLTAALCTLVWRRPLALLLWLPWLRWASSMAANDRWPLTHWPRLLLKLGLLFGLHAVTAAGLVYGSLRARRIVL